MLLGGCEDSLRSLMEKSQQLTSDNACYVTLAILAFAGLPLRASAGERRRAVGASTAAGVSSVWPAWRPSQRGRRSSRRSSRWRGSLTRKARPPSFVPLSPASAAGAEAVPVWTERCGVPRWRRPWGQGGNTRPWSHRHPQAPHSLWRTYIGHRLCHTGPGVASWQRRALERPRAVAAPRPGTRPSSPWNTSMALPTAGNTSACGPVGTTVQALRIPSTSRSVPQRPPIGALLVAVSCAPRPTRPQPPPHSRHHRRYDSRHRTPVAARLPGSTHASTINSHKVHSSAPLSS